MPYVYRRDEDVDRTPPAPYVFRPNSPHETKRRPHSKEFNPELCGTTKGYWQHRRFDQKQCPGCAQAQAGYAAGYRERKQKEGGNVGEGHPPLLHPDQRVSAAPENQDAQ